MQKGNVAVPFLLAVLLIIIIGGYFFINKFSEPDPIISPKQGIEENLETYTNFGIGIAFKYTKDLKVKEDSEEEFNQRAAGSASKSVNGDFRKNFKGYVGYEPGKFLGATSVIDETGSFDTNPFTVWVFDNSENLSEKAWYEKFWYYPFVWGDYTARKFNIAPENEATVGGQIAKYGIVDYQIGSPKFIYLSKDKKMYLFRIIGEEGNKILSTFKLLE